MLFLNFDLFMLLFAFPLIIQILRIYETVYSLYSDVVQGIINIYNACKNIIKKIIYIFSCFKASPSAIEQRESIETLIKLQVANLILFFAVGLILFIADLNEFLYADCMLYSLYIYMSIIMVLISIRITNLEIVLAYKYKIINKIIAIILFIILVQIYAVCFSCSFKGVGEYFISTSLSFVINEMVIFAINIIFCICKIIGLLVSVFIHIYNYSFLNLSLSIEHLNNCIQIEQLNYIVIIFGYLYFIFSTFCFSVINTIANLVIFLILSVILDIFKLIYKIKHLVIKYRVNIFYNCTFLINLYITYTFIQWITPNCYDSVLFTRFTIYKPDVILLNYLIARMLTSLSINIILKIYTEYSYLLLKNKTNLFLNMWNYLGPDYYKLNTLHEKKSKFWGIFIEIVFYFVLYNITYLFFYHYNNLEISLNNIAMFLVLSFINETIKNSGFNFQGFAEAVKNYVKILRVGDSYSGGHPGGSGGNGGGPPIPPVDTVVSTDVQVSTDEQTNPVESSSETNLKNAKWATLFSYLGYDNLVFESPFRLDKFLTNPNYPNHPVPITSEPFTIQCITDSKNKLAAILINFRTELINSSTWNAAMLPNGVLALRDITLLKYFVGFPDANTGYRTFYYNMEEHSSFSAFLSVIYQFPIKYSNFALQDFTIQHGNYIRSSANLFNIYMSQDYALNCYVPGKTLFTNSPVNTRLFDFDMNSLYEARLSKNDSRRYWINHHNFDISKFFRHSVVIGCDCDRPDINVHDKFMITLFQDAVSIKVLILTDNLRYVDNSLGLSGGLTSSVAGDITGDDNIVFAVKTLTKLYDNIEKHVDTKSLCPIHNVPGSKLLKILAIMNDNNANLSGVRTTDPRLSISLQEWHWLYRNSLSKQIATNLITVD